MNLTLESRARHWPVAARRLLAPIPFFLMSCLTFAANLEDAASAPPVQTVSLVYVVLFLILFFGMIAGFFVYLARTWRRDEENKKQVRS